MDNNGFNTLSGLVMGLFTSESSVYILFWFKKSGSYLLFALTDRLLSQHLAIYSYTKPLVSMAWL